jgi:Porin PorA
MFTRKRIFIVAGLTLLSLSAVWRFVLVPRWTERIPAGWQWGTNFVGHQTYADPQTGQIPEKDVANTYNHLITIVANSRRPDSVELNDVYMTHTVGTGEVSFEYRYRALVDPRTGAHLKEEYRGDHFLFPRNVERRTYNLRFSYIKGVPVSFQREEEIQGLDTYVFAHHGRGEFTESYEGTPEFPGVHVKPGQEIKCADDQFVFKAWVEPLTGEIIKIEENCLSSDSIYDIASGKQLQVIDRWGGETEGNDVNNRVETVRRERTKLLWQQRYFPLCLLVAGLLCCGFTLLPKKVT